MNSKPAINQTELLTLAYAQHPKLPKAGDVIWNHGHPFIVTDPQVFRTIGNSGSRYTHQFNYSGVCTEDAANDSIRKTGFNGGRYGYGINVVEPEAAR